MAETSSAQQMLDQEMIARIGRRDQSAFSALYDRMSGPLYSLAMKMLGDPAEAQDALQDVFLQIWSRAGKAGIASSAGRIVLPLFSFNLGVELGQVMVAAVALPIIWKLRENPMFVARWAPACSAAVVLLGSFWLVERVCMN
jgi:hypothetical protein